jgi:hypothetical protein
MTQDTTFTFNNPTPGRTLAITLKQAAAGGKKITAITVTGYTVEMDDSLATINTPGFLTANAHVVLFLTLAQFGPDLIAKASMSANRAVSFA